jgi:hypothetical protein
MANDRRILMREQRSIGTLISCMRLIPQLLSHILPLCIQLCDNHHNKEVFVRRKGLEILANVLANKTHEVPTLTKPSCMMDNGSDTNVFVIYFLFNHQ